LANRASGVRSTSPWIGREMACSIKIGRRPCVVKARLYTIH
jgi:hypothetical protein